MSDISLHFEWYELLMAAPIFGWPGGLIGAVLGALAWRRRRIVGGVLGAALGCMIWFFASILLK